MKQQSHKNPTKGEASIEQQNFQLEMDSQSEEHHDSLGSSDVSKSPLGKLSTEIVDKDYNGDILPIVKQIRLSKDNEKLIRELLKDAKMNLLTIPRVANIAIEEGLPSVRKAFVKKSK